MYDWQRQQLGEHIHLDVRPLVTPNPVLFPMDSDTMITFLLPVIGPTATLVLHRCARLLREQGALTLEVAEFAPHFGVGPGSFADALNRLGNFGFVSFVDGVWRVGLECNYIPVRWIDRMPKVLAASLMEWQRLVATKAS